MVVAVGVRPVRIKGPGAIKARAPAPVFVEQRDPGARSGAPQLPFCGATAQGAAMVPATAPAQSQYMWVDSSVGPLFRTTTRGYAGLAF